jgi:type IV secretion system protein VirB1
MDTTSLLALALACAPAVHPQTAHALVQAESSFNPHAIGVVGGRLERQPKGRAEALATARQLLNDGWNFSVGLAQINRHNLARLGLTLETALEPCSNLQSMQSVLLDCFERASPSSGDPQHALRRAFSCYYSGNFRTGFDHGYVRRVVAGTRTIAKDPQPPP